MVRTSTKTNNKHRLSGRLCRNGSGSFMISTIAEDVERNRRRSGLGASKRTKSCVEGYIWGLWYDRKLVARLDDDGEVHFKPTPAVAAALKAVEREFSDKGLVPLTMALIARIGRFPTVTKAKLYFEFHKSRLMTDRQAAEIERLTADIATGSTKGAGADSGTGLGTDVNPVRSVGGSNAVGGRHVPGARPHTPQRVQPAGSYLTPPHTNSPIVRHNSEAGGQDPGFADDDNPFVADFGAGPSGLSNTGQEGFAVNGKHKLELAQAKEQQARAEAEAQRLADEREVQTMLLDQAQKRNEVLTRERDVSREQNEVLVRERDVSRIKHWGAEAALRGSHIRFRKLTDRFAIRMQEATATNLAQLHMF